MLKGIDISSYQSSTPNLAGLSFVFIKVTEGLSYTNPKWRQQAATARAAGAVVGLYHYPHIGNGGTTEAGYFLAQAATGLQTGDVLILDWEWYGQTVTNQQARDYKTAFLAALHSARPTHRRVLYCDRSVWTGVDTDSNAGDGLWIADYVTAGQPRIQATWAFHQYTDAAPQGGDGDVANPALFPTAAALRAWTHSLEPAPAPSPAPKPPAPAPAPTFLEDDMFAYLPPIPANTDVDVPVEPAGTATAPQGGAKNGPIWLALAAQGADGTAAVSLHQSGKWVAAQIHAVSRAGGKVVVSLPQDGSVDVVRVHSTVPLVGYVVGRQVS